MYTLFNSSGKSAGCGSKKDGLGLIPDIKVEECHHLKEMTFDKIAIDLNASQWGLLPDNKNFSAKTLLYRGFFLPLAHVGVI